MASGLWAMSFLTHHYTARKIMIPAVCALTVLGLFLSCFTPIKELLSPKSIVQCAAGGQILSTLMRQELRKSFIQSESFEIRQRRNTVASRTLAAPSHKVQLPSVTVYYVWCKSQYFEFRHYLSVKSAIQNLQPHNVILYYRYYPHIDSKLYNTWLSELQQDFPFLETVEVPHEGCQDGKPSMSFIYQLTNEQGGIYLGENTILTHPLPDRHHTALFSVRENTGDIDFLVLNEKLSCEPDLVLISKQSKQLDCLLVSILQNTTVLPSCIILDDAIFPKDIHVWYLESAFGRFSRKLFYGSSELPEVRPSYDELVPNIGHMIWFGGGRMNFLFFLGVLSLLHVARVDMVYIHGDKPPAGYYWSLFKDNPRVIHVPQYGIHTIYGQTVKSYNHKSDVLRAELMYRYGGIYLDVDAVFVKELDYEMRGYDAVASFDWVDWEHPYPEIINFGVTMGKKKAEFWRLFRESMKWFIDDDFSWNGLRRPYQILERDPNLIRIDPHLQVICFKYKCHPTWWKDFHNESIHHHIRGLDWRNDAYSFHWTLPTPAELLGFDQLQSSNSYFAEIGKYIVNRSGLIRNLTETNIDENGEAV